MKRQAGMTLIELVIVIIVLGIIAAVAAPKLADITGKAKTASIDGSLGAFKSAITITQAVAGANTFTWTNLTDNLDGFDVATATQANLDLDGDTVDDITILSYTDAGCVTAATANGDTILSWDNTAGAAGCQNL